MGLVAREGLYSFYFTLCLVLHGRLIWLPLCFSAAAVFVSSACCSLRRNDDMGAALTTLIMTVRRCHFSVFMSSLRKPLDAVLQNARKQSESLRFSALWTVVCVKKFWCLLTFFKRSAQVQYNCNTRKKFLYCSCIVVVLHLCGPLYVTT